MKNNKNLVIGVAVIMALVVIGAIVWPLAEQRNVSIDRAIESDFRDLRTMVEDDYNENRRLPDSLNDLQLSDDMKARADKYRYELEKETSRSYKLCADFKTDTRTEGNAYEQEIDFPFSSSSSLYYGGDQQHSAGFDCIEYQVFGYYGDTTSEPFESFFDSGASGSSEDFFLDTEIQEL